MTLHKIHPVCVISIVISVLLVGCSSGSSTESDTTAVQRVFGACGSGAPLELPCGFPLPREDAANPLSVEKIALGRLLFYDRNMSFNQTQSCADCHLQEKAFTDGLTVSIGSEGHIHPRNAMTMTNVVYNGTMNWANNQVVNLVQQAHAVITNEDPIELGWVGHETELLSRLSAPAAGDYTNTPFAVTPPDYPALFAAAFPDEVTPVNMSTFTRAVAAFGSTFISGDSDFDKENRGESNNMSDAARRGRDLFSVNASNASIAIPVSISPTPWITAGCSSHRTASTTMPCITWTATVFIPAITMDFENSPCNPGTRASFGHRH